MSSSQYSRNVSTVGTFDWTGPWFACSRSLSHAACVCSYVVPFATTSNDSSAVIVFLDASAAWRLSVTAPRAYQITTSVSTTRTRDQAFSAAEAARATSETVSALEDVVKAARETVEVAAFAHRADERDREIRRLRDIGELVERIFEKAAAAAGATRPAWRCIEQRELPPLLVGTMPPMPKCDHLAGESQADSVMTAAVAAREEVSARLRELHAAGHR
jgi:hypothetical protein